MQQLRRAEPARHRTQRLGDHCRGDLACLMAAGAVRDCPHAEIGTIDKIVLVARANGADMRRGRGAEPPRR